MDEASRALNDEKTFTAELREQRIQYEQQYREYIRQLRLEEVITFNSLRILTEDIYRSCRAEPQLQVSYISSVTILPSFKDIREKHKIIDRTRASA